MLKLIKCEFWKLKRKRLLYALMSLSLFFPLILAYMAKAGTGADTTAVSYTHLDVYKRQLQGGAAMVCALYGELDGQELAVEALRRIVQAELMGQFYNCLLYTSR